MIKLRKLIMGAMGHKFDMKKHEVGVGDGSYVLMGLHVVDRD